jgi:curved DNA-binding protein CbpA
MNDAWNILGIAPDSNDEEIRAAYVRLVKEHPPDRSPEKFEQIRDAYDLVRNPRRRIRERLLAAEPFAPFVSLIDAGKRPRRFAGPAPWLEVLRGK